jgi:hypothetical protein
MNVTIDNGYFNYNCPCCTLWFDEGDFRNHLPYQATELIIDGLKELCKTLEMQTPPKGAMVIPAHVRDNEDIEARTIAKQKILTWWEEIR